MGKKKFCLTCGSEIKDSRKQRIERAGIMRMLKMIKIAGIDQKDKDLKGSCYDCWKTEMRSTMKPFAEQLGKDASDW